MIRSGNKTPEVTVERHKATPEELAEHRDFAARCEKLHIDMHPELLEKYPDKYVALTEGWALLVGDSMDELIALASERGESSNFAWDFLGTRPSIRVIVR